MTITLELLRDALGWCGLFNIGALVIWFVCIAVADDFVYKIHSTWFKISKKKFDAIHYTGLMLFKGAVLMFNIVPYLALRIVG